jgi:PBP4 family serine-type D-alanyl-D-alanine carboxypeptidase
MRLSARFLVLVLLVLYGPAHRAALAGTDPDAAAVVLRERLDNLLTSHKQPKVRMGARVIELPTGRVLYECNADQPMLPASNMKLVVLAAAVDRLGPDYELKTVLAARKKDLILVGGGDPTIGDWELAAGHAQPVTAVFHEWAEKLKAAGVKRIAGDIVIDDSVFDRQFVHPNWPPDQAQRHYEAPVGGLNFHDNCTHVRVSPTKPGERAAASFVPGCGFLRLENKTVTGAKSTATVNRSANSDVIVVSGSVAGEGLLGPITVRDPGLYCGHVFKTVLASQGIPVAGTVVREVVRSPDGSLPKDLRILAVHKTPLSVALARAGKDSHGLTAEAIFKLLGEADGDSGSWKSGRAAVYSFLKKAGSPEGQVAVDDGSGLSRLNRLSATAVTQVLLYIYNAAGGKFQALRSALSCAGTDGTLEKRMRSPAVKGRVIAKTGYINGVRTLAGYVHTSSGRWLAFAFYYNDAAKTRPLTRIQDQACELLVHWPNIPAAKGPSARESSPKASKPTGRKAAAHHQ